MIGWCLFTNIHVLSSIHVKYHRKKRRKTLHWGLYPKHLLFSSVDGIYWIFYQSLNYRDWNPPFQPDIFYLSDSDSTYWFPCICGRVSSTSILLKSEKKYFPLGRLKSCQKSADHENDMAVSGDILLDLEDIHIYVAVRPRIDFFFCKNPWLLWIANGKLSAQSAVRNLSIFTHLHQNSYTGGWGRRASWGFNSLPKDKSTRRLKEPGIKALIFPFAGTS